MHFARLALIFAVAAVDISLAVHSTNANTTLSNNERSSLPGSTTSHVEDSLYVLTSVHEEARLAIVECYVLSDLPDARESCCKAIALSELHVLPRHTVLAYCRGNLRTIPTVPDLPMTQRAPSFLLVEQEQQQHDTVVKETGRASWTRYLWDDLRQSGSYLDKNDPDAVYELTECFRLPYMKATFAADIVSELGTNGGMHRSLKHSIQVRGLPQLHPNEMHVISLWIMMILPQEMYVLQNEAFEISNSMINATLYAAETIDEEEPSFASPSHVVFIHVQANVEESQPRIEFATWLHIRYLQPSVYTNTSSNPQTTTTITMLAPHLVAGQVTSIDSNDHRTLMLLQFAGLHQHARLSATASIPLQADDVWAVLVSLTVSVLGAFAVLKQILHRTAYERLLSIED
jgi:hypothetical protein